MGARADHDLWGQALAYESRYGDCALDVIAEKIDQLGRDGDAREMEFWIEVADCLTQLHAIKWSVGILHREGPKGRVSSGPRASTGIRIGRAASRI